MTVIDVWWEENLAVSCWQTRLTVISENDYGIRLRNKDSRPRCFFNNPSNYFRRERPDHHTLIVFDQQGQRTLYVRHINSSAIKVLGTFHTPRGIIRIEENRVVFPGNKVFTGFCFGNKKVDIQLN